MSSEGHFPLASLAEVATFINGDRSTNYPGQDDYTEGGIPFVSASDLRDERIQTQTVKRITPAAFARLRAGKFEPDDVLFCLRGSIGKLALVSQGETGAIASSLVIVRANANVDPRFLFSFLRSAGGQQSALSLNNGSAQPNVSVQQLQRVRLPLPPRKVQSEIAIVLGSLDDRIALLRETNTSLEAIAQALFKSWFVDFDPVRAKQQGLAPAGMDEATAALFPDSFEESALGWVPKGWAISPLGNHCKLQWGNTTITKKSYVAEGVQAFSAAGQDGYVAIAERSGVGSVISAIGTVGVVHLAYGKWTAIKNTLTAQCDDDEQSTWLHFLLKTVRFPSRGSTQQFISQGDARAISVVSTPTVLRRAFGNIALPLIERLVANCEEAQTLTNLRDTLLPRLISGQLRLPAAEVALEAA